MPAQEGERGVEIGVSDKEGERVTDYFQASVKIGVERVGESQWIRIVRPNSGTH